MPDAVEKTDAPSPQPDFCAPAPEPEHAPKKILRPAHCPCGAPLTQLRFGRPRCTCCAWSKRRRDTARRMMARRLRWIEDWRREAGAGTVPVADADAEVQALEDDIAELRRLVDWTGGAELP